MGYEKIFINGNEITIEEEDKRVYLFPVVRNKTIDILVMNYNTKEERETDFIYTITDLYEVGGIKIYAYKNKQGHIIWCMATKKNNETEE